MTNAVSLAQYGSTSPSWRNRIINGDFRIDQRNAGASVTATSDGQYTVDRWKAGLTQSSKFSVQQSSTAPAGFINSLRITSLSAYSVGSGDTFLFQQNIEGLNIADLGWGTASAKTVTLSFQVYSSLTGTFGGSLLNGSANRAYPFSYTVSSANTWTPVSITIAGDTTGTWLTTNGVGLCVRFGLGSGATFSGTSGAWAAGNIVQPTGTVSVVGTNGATFYITGVQLEVGTAATQFEYRDYGRELIMCQRYCESITPCAAVGVVNSSTGAYLEAKYQVTKRSSTQILTAPAGTYYMYNYTSGNSASTTVPIIAGSNVDNALLTFSGYTGLVGGQAVFLTYGSPTMLITSEL
jgi:hypothetical protein